MEIRTRRTKLRQKYRSLYDEVGRILFKHDPMAIGAAQDEYEPEVERLLPKLEKSRSVSELTGHVHEVFRKMFGAELAGPKKKYEAIAKDLWRLART